MLPIFQGQGLSCFCEVGIESQHFRPLKISAKIKQDREYVAVFEAKQGRIWCKNSESKI